MSNSALVSIIIPMYNCAAYLQQCLKSVAGQSWRNIEAILVDDCSTDDTIEICRAFVMFSYCWGRLFSASIIKKENLRFISHQRICEDVLFNFQYMRHAQQIHYINSTTYFYRFGRPQSAAMVFVLKGDKPLLFFHDIWTAYPGIFSFIETYGVDCHWPDVQRVTRLGHISHAIVFLVRACGCSRGKSLFELVRKMVFDPTVQENLQYYYPLQGQSRLIPLSLRMKLVLPLILLCRYKYRKRYGKKRK